MKFTDALQIAGVALGIGWATEYNAYADKAKPVELGDGMCVMPCPGTAAPPASGSSAQARPPVAAVSRPATRAAPKKGTKKASKSSCNPCADIKALQKRVDGLEQRAPGRQYGDLQEELDNIYNLLDQVSDSLNIVDVYGEDGAEEGKKSLTLQDITERIDGLYIVIHHYAGIIDRLEHDDALQLAKNAFSQGPLQELRTLEARLDKRDPRYEAKKRELYFQVVDKVAKNLVREEQSGPLRLLTGVGYRHDGDHGMSVHGGVCYEKDQGFKLCVVLGAGYAGQTTDMQDLSQPESRRDLEKGYTRVASQTGTETRRSRYQSHGELRVGWPRLLLGDDATVSFDLFGGVSRHDKTVTHDVTRISQLEHDGQPDGQPNEVPDVKTEEGSRYTPFGGAGVDICYGDTLCLRLSAGAGGASRRHILGESTLELRF